MSRRAAAAEAKAAEDARRAAEAKAADDARRAAEDAYDIGPLLAGMAFVQPNVYWESAVSRSLGSTPKYPFGSICWVIGPIAADCSVCNFGLRARGRLLRFRHGER
jgi:hypothetical protein